jgi:hypothetical protein
VGPPNQIPASLTCGKIVGRAFFFATVEAISGSGAPLTLSGKIGGVDP